MRVFLKGFGVAAVLVVVSTVAVFASNSYFTKINASDKQASSELTSIITEYFDSMDYDQRTREENNKNNSDILLNSGETSGDDNTGGETARPDFVSGLEAYLYALNRYMTAKSVVVETSGYADTAIGKQYIKVIRQRNSAGHLYYTALAYSDFIQVAREAYYDGRIFRQRTSDKVSAAMVPSFDGNWIQSTSFVSAMKNYKQKYGVGPDELNYIVSAESIKSETFDKNICKQSLDNGGTYTFTLQLHPNIAGEKYKYSVKENAGAKNLPNFEMVEIEVTINAKGDFVKVVSKDKYSLTVAGVTSDVRSVVTDTFVRIDNKSFDVNVPSGL